MKAVERVKKLSVDVGLPSFKSLGVKGRFGKIGRYGR